MDAPGIDSVIANTIIGNSDIVISPVQANQDEIRSVGQAAENTADMPRIKVGRSRMGWS